MKLLIRTRYILFALIILGCFANFAQNEYGLTMILWAFIGIISVTFIEAIIEIANYSKTEKSKKIDSLFSVSEKISLAVLFLLFIINFYESPSLMNVAVIFGVQTGMIMVVWLKNSLLKYNVPVPKYIYLFGIISFPLFPAWYYLFTHSLISSGIWFSFISVCVCINGFLITFWHYKFIGKSDYGNFWRYSLATKYYKEFAGADLFSFVIVLIVGVYIGLWAWGVAPEIFSGKYPPAYRALLKENKKEQAETYWKNYNQFLENHKKDNN